MIEEKIRKMLLEILDAKEADIVWEAHLRRDLGVTSIDLVDFVAALENEFRIQVSDAELRGLLTVKDAIDIVGRKLA